MKPFAPSALVAPVESRDVLAADFESVVEAYRPAVFRFALASLRDRDEAETITQDCFWKAYRNRASFRGECSMKTWLMQIAVNLIRDRVRNSRLQFWRRASRASTEPLQCRLAGLPGTSQSPERLLVLRESVEAVWSAARRLPEKQRTVFLLRFVEDMDILEIAAVTGMKEGTVKTHLFRALEAVRKYSAESKGVSSL